MIKFTVSIGFVIYSASNLRRPGSANQAMQNVGGSNASSRYRQKPTNVVRPSSATSRSGLDHRDPMGRIARDRSVSSIQSGMSALSNASGGKKAIPKRKVVRR